MAFTQAQREQMEKDLMERTQQSYDRRDGDTSNRHFDPELDIPFYKPEVTKGKPHIIDILPWFAGPNFPTKPQPTPEGKWVYVLDLWVHKKVGPGKAVVVCPARNYGNRCPICEEIDNLVRDGVEYEDIPFNHKRQCTYNVLVMDDEETESKGVQVWDVSYKYSEKAIVTAAVSARGGGVIPFANPNRKFGRSLVFDVAKDKYKTISGHRFELRDYDIPEDLLEECYPLDTMIKIYSYDELCVLLYGEGGKPPEDGAQRRLLIRKDEKPENEQPAASSGTGRRLISRKAAEEPDSRCGVGAKFGYDYNKFGECDKCDDKQACAEALDMIEYKASKAGSSAPPEQSSAINPAPASEPEPAAAAPAEQPAGGGKRLLLRRK